MRQYAERLTKAAPERFVFEEFPCSIFAESSGDTDMKAGWRLSSDRGCITDNSGLAKRWAFWGPLWGEQNPTYFGHGDTWLERVADAVCRSFEAEKS